MDPVTNGIDPINGIDPEMITGSDVNADAGQWLESIDPDSNQKAHNSLFLLPPFLLQFH